MKNITIKLDDDLARWCKIWAAQHGTSVSRFLADLLRRARHEQDGYARAMEEFLAVKPRRLKESGGYPAREDVHGR